MTRESLSDLRRLAGVYSLPPRQRASYDFLVRYKEKHDGNAPSREIIAAQSKCSSQNIDQQLLRLYEKGLIDFDEQRQIVILGGKWIGPLVSP